MKYSDIKEAYNENGAKVYHIVEVMAGEPIIQEFWSLKEAKDYVLYIQQCEKEGEQYADNYN